MNQKHLSVTEITQILHHNARLNRVHSGTNDVVKGKQLELAKESINKITQGGMNFINLKKIGKILWSLACMEIIRDIDKFELGLKIHQSMSITSLELAQYSYDYWKEHDIYFHKKDKKGIVPSFIQQLFIAVAEIMIGTENCEVQQLIERYPIISIARKYRSVANYDSKRSSSSWLHQDVSKALTCSGITHEIEKPLEYGYVADIFVSQYYFPSMAQLQLNGGKITHSYFEKRSRGIDRGLIIEINGPSHYESYLGRELGHTLQKQRHLKALGYNVVAISYTAYDSRKGLTHEEKMKVLLDSVFDNF